MDPQGFDEAPVSGQQQARMLLSKLALCLKLATMHRLDNAALVPPIRGLLEAVNPLLSAGEQIQLQAVGENFYLNREIIKLDFGSYESGLAFRTCLKRVGVNEVSLTAALEESELRDFLGKFQAYYHGREAKGFLKERFAKIGLRWIGKAEEAGLGAEIDERQNVVRSLAVLALSIEAQLGLMKAGKPPRLSKVRRAIHGLADASTGHEALLVGLTRFEALSGQVHFHLASVSALSLLMGRRLGLSRPVLTELCMAAALHDLARDDLGAQADPGAAERVPLKTVLRLCAGGTSAEVLERAAVAFEHAQPKGPHPTGFGQLIAVPCAFDLLASPPPPCKGLLPDHALRVVLDQAGSRFDPRVVRLFAAVVGMYPVGTTVRLSSGEIAVVLEAADPSQAARPRVKVVRTAEGPADFLLDLSAPGEKRSVVSSVDPGELEINVPQFLLA